MNSEPKILVVIISTGEEPFTSMEQGQKDTWIADDGPVRTIWFEGNGRLTNRRFVKAAGALMGWVQKAQYGSPRRYTIGKILPNPLPRKNNSFGAAGRDFLSRGWTISISWSVVFEWLYRHGNLFSGLIWGLLRIGTSKKVTFFGDRARCEFPVHWFLLTPISFLKYQFVSKTFDFDYVLFTTATCYIRPAQLAKNLSNASRTRFYGGQVLSLLGHPFVSGNSVILSPDVLRSVLARKKYYRLDIPDDVALGRLIRDFDLAEASDLPSVILPLDATIPDDLKPGWESSHLIRCKTQQVSRDSSSVVERMREVHTYLKSSIDR